MKHENKWGLEDLDETPYKAAGSPRHAAMTIEEQQTKHEGTLEEILAGAKRIKNTAGGLNNEVVAQNHLIQDISQVRIFHVLACFTKHWINVHFTRRRPMYLVQY
ncbi:hypothetical protein, variant [Aphanomyces astaci]|uniref:t-SNARE coiled-coil homology domain-containing protein n=1 Tax=Aphanomyces astaci TaxID=112090 RepID=W4GBL3_APHAT|nr:hypothetical protein, variant [Aphanomyces astaci]ETV76671.1 hypothetical protein, variant [Aphanomyces astaci]|eukprot:XP_009833582.1 hypothetical protein, variant [Aphanomyces astaci]